MSKSKKLTFNMVSGMMPQCETKTIKLNDEMEIEIKTHLTLKEAIAFIENVVASCVDTDTGKYTPEAYELALRVNALVYYAGFDQPKDISKAYDVVFGTNIYSNLTAAISKDEYYSIITAIDDKINHFRRMFAAGATSAVNELIGKIDEMIESGNEVMQYTQSDEFKSILGSVAKATHEDFPVISADVEDVAGDIVKIGDTAQPQRGTVIPLAKPGE